MNAMNLNAMFRKSGMLAGAIGAGLSLLAAVGCDLRPEQLAALPGSPAAVAAAAQLATHGSDVVSPGSPSGRIIFCCP
ncbi:MAG TPA: hypothetical protein VGM03_03450 [Phycisphaerae bacterium]